jgi:nickel superoxide dismutase
MIRIALAVGLVLMVPVQVLAHCQVPCGIYDDEMRFAMIGENITTAEKAIRQVEMLSKADEVDYNQIVRWTNVKDEHADDIAEIVSWYFLQQRVKPASQEDEEAFEAYVGKLTLLHEMLVYAMKVKQSKDLANIERLKVLLDDFETAYFGVGHEKRHMH